MLVRKTWRREGRDMTGPDDDARRAQHIEPDDLEHRRIPVGFRFVMCLALTLIAIAGAALAGAPETSPPPMPRPEAGE